MTGTRESYRLVRWVLKCAKEEVATSDVTIMMASLSSFLVACPWWVGPQCSEGKGMVLAIGLAYSLDWDLLRFLQPCPISPPCWRLRISAYRDWILGKVVMYSLCQPQWCHFVMQYSTLLSLYNGLKIQGGDGEERKPVEVHRGHLKCGLFGLFTVHWAVFSVPNLLGCHVLVLSKQWEVVIVLEI